MDMLVSYQNKNSLQRQKVDKKADKKAPITNELNKKIPMLTAFLRDFMSPKAINSYSHDI